MSKTGSGFEDVADPFGEIDTEVPDRYEPPVNASAWERQQVDKSQPEMLDLMEDDEPFTAAHLAASLQSSVPAVQPTITTTPSPTELDVNLGGVSNGKKGRSYGSSDKPAAPVPPQSQTTQAMLQSFGGTANFNGSSSLPVEDPASYPFYSVKRYRSYYDVDTEQVLGRMFRAVALFFKGDFVDHINSNPDLYGPFWIASTLVFVSAAAGNTASYIAFHHKGGTSEEPTAAWYYDVDKVGGSMGLFYGYVGVIGMVLWAVLRWFQGTVGLAHVWCVYGYALTAYIPMAALCILPMEAVRWSLVSVATAMSGAFLLLNLKTPVTETMGSKAVPVLLTIAGLHAGLGLALKMYFFQYPT